MRPLIHEIPTAHTPESLVEQLLSRHAHVVMLRTGQFDLPSARYSFVAANPFLTFRSFGSRCEVTHSPSVCCGVTSSASRSTQQQFGNPWHLLDSLMSRFELLDEIDSPFPLGGAFGFWGYDLKNFTEPKLPRRAVNDLELPDCHVGFYDSLVVFDHRLGRVSVVATGLDADGSRSEARAGERLEFWQKRLAGGAPISQSARWPWPPLRAEKEFGAPIANICRADFIAAVERAQKYIRSGDIYQVNLSQRITADFNAERRLPTRRVGEENSSKLRIGPLNRSCRREEASAEFRDGMFEPPHVGCHEVQGAERGELEFGAPALRGWELFVKLAAISPAPFSAFLDCGEFQIASSSPEQFLRMSGPHIVTRPIKGTRPRDTDPTRDAQLAYELQTNAKELAELVMITDLLRNDLGKVCEFGSVQTPEIAKLEKFAQVQHLVSTVEGRLRNDVTHFAAFASCFPGGSITGAPKFRAMEIIDELEPVSRGPYCGALGYLGFNRESQLSIIIRTAICQPGAVHFHVGAGIVADSDAAAEYEETLAKARGFLNAIDVAAFGRRLPSTKKVAV